MSRGIMNMYDSTMLQNNNNGKSPANTLNILNTFNEPDEHIEDQTNQRKDGTVEQLTQINLNEQKENMFEYDEVVVNLGVISALKEYQRLYINGKYIHIDTRYAQGIIRGWYGDGRDTTINFIQRIVESARLYSQELINTLLDGENVDIKSKLDALTGKLQTTIQGLRSLQITYAEDQVSKSKIDNIIDNKIAQLTKNNTSRIVTMA
jgi:hypothetical protein